ncbi:MAG TPA: formylglycine-generating enzyme family protein, partial [Candidatus Methylomirabilis sp.]|nr:formylglycine-generating enzyme family protein [Candidatus Methylomirabilis sp.]
PIINNSMGMGFVPIPSGEFDMGSPQDQKFRDEDEGPVHRVKIDKAFYMSNYEITQKQWRNVTGTDPSYFKGDNLPVEQVSWNDTQEFIKKLNKNDSSHIYRLPSEAEWEYAAGAGNKTIYYFGDNESDLGDYAWYDMNSGRETHEAGKKKPNKWGLYDMHGNVWEWVQDVYYDSYQGAPTDGSAWEGNASHRIIRGGSIDNHYGHLRLTNRNERAPDFRQYTTGFRLVMMNVTKVPIPDSEFVLIPPGEFDMGSPQDQKFREKDEGPVHRVKIAKAFNMSKYEITQKQWRDVMGTNVSNFKGDNLPVENVSWNDVQEFIKKLNDISSPDKYRLPSEAEWEYAAGAGNRTIYYFGDNESELGDYAWYDNNSGRETHEVGKKKPNKWGLYDMHGNVWEWVQDVYHDSYQDAPTDGSAWEGNASHRVIRGGSFDYYYEYLSLTSRNNRAPEFRQYTTGFRLVKDS